MRSWTLTCMTVALEVEQDWVKGYVFSGHTKAQAWSTTLPGSLKWLTNIVNNMHQMTTVVYILVNICNNISQADSSDSEWLISLLNIAWAHPGHVSAGHKNRMLLWQRLWTDVSQVLYLLTQSQSVTWNTFCGHYIRPPCTLGQTAAAWSSGTFHRVLAQTTWPVIPSKISVLPLLYNQSYISC